jgi:enoyl-CoA hydratase/carnithine racemase
MADKLVNYASQEGLAIIELTDPPANTYTYEMMHQLDAAILKARIKDSVHMIVLKGSVRNFCAGANIRMLQEVTPRFKYFFCLHANETLNRLEHTPKLVIAALNGHCVGGGLEIAMTANIRLTKKGTGKIGLPEVTLGVLPSTSGTQRLARLVGKSRAIELMTTGRAFEFEEAEKMGLVNHVLPAENFWEKVLEYARQFLPPNKASKAVGLIKRSVQSGIEVSFSESLAIERELQQQLFQSEDAKEGLTAYNEKRKPNFAGGNKWWWFLEQIPVEQFSQRILALVSCLLTFIFLSRLCTPNSSSTASGKTLPAAKPSRRSIRHHRSHRADCRRRC